MNNVDHPTHYNQHSIEVIDIIRNSMSEAEYKGFLKGNVIKYICRSEYKNNEIEDLQKADWYLTKLIQSINL